MRIIAVSWLALPLLLASCRAPFGTIRASTAGTHLDQIEAEVRAGAFGRALEHLIELRSLSGLETDLRAREDRLTDEAARGRFTELVDGPLDELEALFESELPERVRAQAGILAAEHMLAQGRRISAYRQVKLVDDKLPGHPWRVLGGEVVARAGLALIRDEGRYNLILHYRPRGVQALEYLVVHYPDEPRSGEALFALSEAYEGAGDFDQAIESSEDLRLHHPESPYAPAASARLPYLRLSRLGRDDYDRGELKRARDEISAWLERYPQHELAGWMGELQHECAARLVRNDLYLARFYLRTEALVGQRLHAARAQALALEVGLEAEAESARLLLVDLPELDEPAQPAQPDVP